MPFRSKIPHKHPLKPPQPRGSHLPCLEKMDNRGGHSLPSPGVAQSVSHICSDSVRVTSHLDVQSRSERPIIVVNSDQLDVSDVEVR